MCAVLSIVLPYVAVAFMAAGFVAHVMVLQLAGEHIQRNPSLVFRVEHALLPWKTLSYAFGLFEPNAFGLLREERRIRIAAIVRAWWLALPAMGILIFTAAYACGP